MFAMRMKQEMIRTALLSVCGVALALLIAACGKAAEVQTSNAIPWTSAPGSQYVAPSVQANALCKPGDLQIRAGHAGAYHGLASQELMVTNQSNHACFLPGAPGMLLRLPDGTKQSVAAGAQAIGRVDLAPGQTSTVLVGTPAGCANASQERVGSDMDLSLATGEGVHVSGVWLNVACGPPSVINFIAGAVPVARTAASGLAATLTVPTTVARGSTLDYTVSLSNPTGAAISLSSCPSYTQSLGPGPVAEQTLQLNCSVVKSLAPGAHTEWAMRMTVPSNMPAGVTKFGWHLEVPDGAAVGAVLTTK